jgi:hypothetical protein
MSKGLFVAFVSQSALCEFCADPATPARVGQQRCLRRALLLIDRELLVRSERAVSDQVHVEQIEEEYGNK